VASEQKHFTNPVVGIVAGALGLILGALLIIGPSRADTGGSGAAGAFPNWALGAILVFVGSYLLILGIRQVRARR